MTVVYISIGNSDDRLTQFEWSDYVSDTHDAIDRTLNETSGTLHGVWFSVATSPFQNACWAVEFDADLATDSWVAALRAGLSDLAGEYRQDSIAWAVAPVTEFLGAGQ